MEYNDLFIEKACSEADPLVRMLLLTAQAMTSYAGIDRMPTKPFNPILNETYEYFSPTYKFVSEQVSHYPPVSAYFVKGDAGYTIQGDSQTKSKFSGKTLQFQMLGIVRFHLD